MALDVSALSTYTDQLTGLGKEVLLNANTIKGDIVSKMYGAVGNAVALNTVKTTATATLSACGQFTDTGSTVMAQQSVALCGIKFPQDICIDTLKKYYYDYAMEKSFNAENLGQFEDVFFANKMDAFSIAIDQMIWRSQSSGVAYVAGLSGNLILCQGFMAVATGLSASTAANITKSAITVSNVLAYMDTVLSQAGTNADEMLENFYVYLSPADYQTYLAAFVSTYKYNAELKDMNGVQMIQHPGSLGMWIVKTNGMSGAASGTFIATPKENAVLVISAEEDINLKAWFSNDFDSFRIQLKVKFGVGFRQPELVIVSR